MPRKIHIDHIQRILVRGPNWVGDAVMCTPALQGLRQEFPEAKITFLARPGVANLLKDHDSLNETILEEPQSQHAGIKGKWRLAQTLKSKSFDLAVLFPNSFDSALVAWLAGIPQRYGYATDGRSVLLTHSIPLSPENKKLHQVRLYEELIRPLCPKYSPHPLSLHVTKEDEAQAVQLLGSHGVSADYQFLGLNPGSMYGGAKRWLPERFAEAADCIVETLATQGRSVGDVKCIIVGAPGEETLGHDIAGLMQTHPIVLSGKTSLGVLKAVIQRCRLFLTNDTGPMHIANALGVPVVAVFGPTDHTTTSPFLSGAVVVRTSVDCSPCLLRECPIDHRCMTGVTVEQVVQAVQQLLKDQDVLPGKKLQVES